MKTERVMKISFITNFLLSCFKIINGFILKSSALIADGIHSFSDLITDVVAIVGDRFANKPNDSEHPYGHGNAEYLTSFIIGLMIILMGLILIKETVQQVVTIPSYLVSVVSLITIVCKYFLASFLMKKGKLYNNNILIASGKESKTDVISSIVVFLSSILILFRNYLDILKYSDKVAGVVVGIFIIVTGFKIVKENTVMILGKKADDTALRNKLLTIPNILNVDDIIMIKYGPYYKAYVEVTMNIRLLKKAHDMAHNIENEIKNELTNIKYINIHVNPK